jgi:transcriptional regulator with XRE-family HTH domain
MREHAKWSQDELAKKVGMNQNAISRLENPGYGKATLTTLRRIASALDVALVVRFVSFRQLADWVSGTPFLDKGLSSESFGVLNFARENIARQHVPALLGRVPNRAIARTQALGLGSFQQSEIKSSAASELAPMKQTAA